MKTASRAELMAGSVSVRRGCGLRPLGSSVATHQLARFRIEAGGAREERGRVPVGSHAEVDEIDARAGHQVAT